MWIRCCITSDAFHALDISRFKTFVDALIDEESTLEPSDIEQMIIDCGKDWPDEIVSRFIERWYPYYENQIR